MLTVLRRSVKPTRQRALVRLQDKVPTPATPCPSPGRQICPSRLKRSFRLPQPGRKFRVCTRNRGGNRTRELGPGPGRPPVVPVVLGVLSDGGLVVRASQDSRRVALFDLNGDQGEKQVASSRVAAGAWQSLAELCQDRKKVGRSFLHAITCSQAILKCAERLLRLFLKGLHAAPICAQALGK